MGDGVQALQGAVVVTVTGAEPFEGSVLVEGDRIVDVVDRVQPSGSFARRVDLRGTTLLPGLIDAHVHAAAIEADIQTQEQHYFESEVAVLAARSLTDMLDRGFTTVRDAGGLDAGFRRLIEHGVIAGPRLHVSGRPLSQTGGHGDSRSAVTSGDFSPCHGEIGMVHRIADGPEEVRKAAREELRRGANQIKVMASGGVMSPTDRLESVQYSLEELTAAVRVATATGTYVLAHAYTPESIAVCVEAGVRSIEHGNLLDADTAKAMAAAGTYLVPTLVTYEKLHAEGDRHGIPKDNLDKLAAIIDAGVESIRHARAAGVAIGSGSDLLGPMRRYQGAEIGLQARALGSLGAIMAATRTNAELLGVAGEVGTIEGGKLADLVAVRGDVLADPDLIGDPAHLVLVMKGGETHILRAD
jgi:imidazolonepropionase-like amidohydrolase